MHKAILASLFVFLTLNSASPAQALTFFNKEERQQIQKEAQDISQEAKDLRKNIKEKIASFPAGMRFFKGGRLAFGSGELTAINGMTLTVKKEDKSYTVLVTENTKLRRKFWGKSELSEFSVGDKLNVVGTWEDEAKTTINARFIRNLSIQMRHGVFFGTVGFKTDAGFTLDTLNRGSQNVTVTAATEYVNRRGETLNFTDVAVGHKVRIRGLWNSKAATITEVTKVKDFSLPPHSSPAASPAT